MAAERARTLISGIDYRNPATRTVYWLTFAALVTGAVTTLLPLAWGILSALKPADKVFAYPPSLLPEPAARPDKWNWFVYIEVFRGTRFVRYFWNTFLLSVCCWIISLVPSALAGYALSKLKPPFRRVLMLLFLATLMVPFQAYMVPLYLTVSRMRIPFLGETLTTAFAGYPAVILPAGVSAFNIFLFKSFFDEIPTSLVESARIDGSSEIGILGRIVLPLSYSIFAVVSIFSFMDTWNDFLWPLLTISDENWKTIMLRLFQFDSQGDVGKNKVLAALMIASVPPLVLFALFQKRIMQGIAAVGVKF